MFKSPGVYSDVKNTIYVVSLKVATKPTKAWNATMEITCENLKIIMNKLALKLVYRRWAFDELKH